LPASRVNVSNRASRSAEILIAVIWSPLPSLFPPPLPLTHTGAARRASG
jgi:hypothetical protein